MRKTVLMVALAVAGCSGEIGNPAGSGGLNPSNSTGSTGAGTTTGGTSTGTMTGTGTSGTPPVESPSPRFVRQLTLSEYQNTVADLLFLANPDTTAIPPDVLMKGYTTNVAGAFVDETHLDAYVSVGSALANRAVAESYAKLVPCQTQDAACAGAFLDKFGVRAFRRPLTADEKTRYLKYFDASLTGGSFKTGVSLAIWGMLSSLHFLFRTELGDGASGVFKLNPYETASALSYAYWGTMPDDALFASAEKGALANKTEIEAQTRRLLADSRGRARIATFFSEWTEASRAYVATKDPATFPALFKDPGGQNVFVDAMKAEADAFITNVVFDSTKKYSELFTANYTFANDRLAGYYGLPLPGTGEKTTKVALKAGSARGGLLTLGMFLFGHGRANQSSPVQRGHLIRANMLCTDVPPPPPNVDATVKPGTPGNTGREQIEALTSSGGACPTCHGLMNPIGFGLEGFGGAAEDRTTDNGEAVDTTGVLNGFTDASGATIKFDGARELSNLLANNPDAQACLAVNYHRYTRGYLANDIDAGAVVKLGRDFVGRNLDMPELFVGIALQDSFTARRSVEVFNQ